MNRKWKRTIAALISACMLSAAPLPAFAKTFDDIQGHWAQPVIEELADKGIIDGESETRYNPEGQVTRAEFVKLLTGTQTEQLPETDPGYPDIPADHWAKGYIAYAKDNGILLESDGGNFEPERPITRNEAAVWISRALKQTGNAAELDFTDNDLIQNREAVAGTVAAGIMTGNEDGSFAPENSMTRAEAAAIISRMIDQENTSEPEPSVTPSPAPSAEPEESAAPAQDLGIVEPKHVAMGKDFTLMLKKDGTVWSSGSNSYGQLGYNENYQKSQGTFGTEPETINSNFRQIPGLNGIKAVYATERAGFAIDGGGTVWSWGDNSGGALGNAAPADEEQTTPDIKSRFTPEKIEGLDPVVKLACGVDHVLALTEKGEVYGWGSNRYGMIGLGDQSYLEEKTEEDDNTFEEDLDNHIHVNSKIYCTPIQITELSDQAVDIASEEYGNAALMKNGEVWTWGQGVGWVTAHETEEISLAEYADPSVLNSIPSPALATSVTQNRLVNMKDVTAGRFHAAAISPEGTVYSWGASGYGQLGAGDTTATFDRGAVQIAKVPSPGLNVNNNLIMSTAKPLSNVVQLEAGGDYTAAVDADGQLWLWGESPAEAFDKEGQKTLSAEEAKDHFVPRATEGMSDITELEIGYQLIDNYSEIYRDRNGNLLDEAERPIIYKLFVVREDGTVWNVGTESEQVFDLN